MHNGAIQVHIEKWADDMASKPEEAVNELVSFLFQVPQSTSDLNHSNINPPLPQASGCAGVEGPFTFGDGGAFESQDAVIENAAEYLEVEH